jgi:hypothetical protein
MLHADDYTLYDTKLKLLYKTLENSCHQYIPSNGQAGGGGSRAEH